MWFLFLNLDWITFLVPDHSRLRLRSVEKEAGAETQVEGEMGVISRLRARRVGLLGGSHGGSGNEGRAPPLILIQASQMNQMVMEISQPAPSEEVLPPYSDYEYAVLLFLGPFHRFFLVCSVVLGYNGSIQERKAGNPLCTSCSQRQIWLHIVSLQPL